MSGDFTIAICDYCRVAVPIDSREKPAWDAQHLHTETEEVDE